MTYKINWRTLSKCFVIKAALPHLLVGVMAAAFSLSNQAAIPVQTSSQTAIVTIASVMVNLYEHPIDASTQSQFVQQPPQNQNKNLSFFPSIYIEPIQVIRLTPNNGIRAGPSSLFV